MTRNKKNTPAKKPKYPTQPKLELPVVPGKRSPHGRCFTLFCQPKLGLTRLHMLVGRG